MATRKKKSILILKCMNLSHYVKKGKERRRIHGWEHGFGVQSSWLDFSQYFLAG